MRYTPLGLLGNKIVHQGTRSEAGLHTVPFLVRMALDPRIPDRHAVVGLLAAIAIGLDNNYLPNGYDPEEDRVTLAELRRESEGWPQWIAEAPTEELRRVREQGCAQVLLDAESAVFSYDAVRGVLPELSSLLKSSDAALRTATAYLLAWFPEAAETSTDLLIDFVREEKCSVTSATAIAALGLLGDPATARFIRAYLDSDAAELRWAAGFALSRLGESDDSVVVALIEAIAEPPRNAEIRVPFLGGDCAALAMYTLATTSVSATPRAIRALLTGFARSEGQGQAHIKEQIFRTVFPGGPWPTERPFSEMNHAQQQTVQFIAGLEPGAWPGFPFGHSAWIDAGRPDLRAYVRLADATPDGGAMGLPRKSL